MFFSYACLRGAKGQLDHVVGCRLERMHEVSIMTSSCYVHGCGCHGVNNDVTSLKRHRNAVATSTTGFSSTTSCVFGQKPSNMPPSKYSRERTKAAIRDPITGPARSYLDWISAPDLGLSEDFQCAIWFVYSLPPI